MQLIWEISPAEIRCLQDFVQEYEDDPFVIKRMARNINRPPDINLAPNMVLKNLIMCLLTSNQRSGPHTPIANFLRLNPFPLTIQALENNGNLQEFIRGTLQDHGLNRFYNRIPNFFVNNLQILRNTNWELLGHLSATLNGQATQQTEREIADDLDDRFSGFGPKQSRNFLQALGLTKYEIPIDSRITRWLKDFGFPIPLSSQVLQNKEYYHFVSDGIQELCDRAEIIPCVLDATIFSSFDHGQWIAENIIY